MSSKKSNQRTLSTLLQWRPFMLLSDQWIYLAYTDLLVGLEVPPKTFHPLWFLISCTSRKENKIREWCAVFLLFGEACFFKKEKSSDLCTRPHCHLLSKEALAWSQILLLALNRCRVETVRQRRYINYTAGRITRLCCCVNLPRTLKARTSEFTLGMKVSILHSTAIIKGWLHCTHK